MIRIRHLRDENCGWGRDIETERPRDTEKDRETEENINKNEKKNPVSKKTLEQKKKEKKQEPLWLNILRDRGDNLL